MLDKKTEMRRISPGAYIAADGALHLSIPEMLDALGIPDTPESRELMTQFCREMLPRLVQDAEIIETD